VGASLDVCIALGLAARVRGTSPVAAKGSVERYSMLLEERLGITLETGPGGLQVRRAPSIRVRGARDITGNIAPREVPNLNALACPFHCDHRTSSCVEWCSETGIGLVDERTPGVRRLTGTARGVSDGGCDGRDLKTEWRRGGSIDFASWCGVDGVLILGVGVNALDDIDLAVVGPISTDGPERWP